MRFEFSSRVVRLCLAVVAGFVLIPYASAEPNLSERIDKLLDKGKPAARQSDDAEFLRRVWLDLAGMIPPPAEARAFLADKSPDRRVKLIDRLLASDAHLQHLTQMLDTVLMDRRPATQVKAPEWLEFLKASITANKPYDQLVREILANDGGDAKNRGPARFWLDRKVEPHQITKDVGRLFLGMNLQCAQCHDHPMVDAYKQDFYYGIYAFVNRTSLYVDKKSKVAVIAEKADGDVTFESVFKPKVVHAIGPKLPGTAEVKEPKFAKGEEYVTPPPKGEPGVPKFSRRSKLGDEITHHPRFARATVNRVWSWLFGRGIVHPVDFDHDANPASNPELLELLTNEFRASNHDLKKLIRDLVLTKAYQRTSELKNEGDDPPAGEFRVAAVRPLSPEQFAWSLVQATGQMDADRNPKTKESQVLAKQSPLVTPIVNLFAGLAGEHTDGRGFEATLDQTLFLSNSKQIETLLSPRAGTLIDRMTKAANAKAAEELYLSVLTRLPSDDERQEVEAFLGRPNIDKTKACQELAWALLTSVEFRFNH
jgi:hypothetical protein